jgi:sugar phosphate isomerase/epimerase
MKINQNKNRSFRISTMLIAFTIALSTIGCKISEQSKSNEVTLGVITYSFRSMPDQSAAATLKYVLESGINSLELMGDPVEAFAGKPKSTVDQKAIQKLKRSKDLSDNQKLQLTELELQVALYKKEVVDWRATVSMDKFAELRKMYNDAGVTIYAFKPNALKKHHTDEEIGWAMRVAKTLGASHVTVELPNDPAQTQRLGDLGEKHDMHIGYHGHTQQTLTWWDTALSQSKYNGINIDLGHYIAAGNTDTFEFIKKNHGRILSMHIKDRQTPENGQHNKVWGQGDTPIDEVLQLIRDNNYTFPATIELEYDIPSGSNAVKEVQKSLAYCKIALE